MIYFVFKQKAEQVVDTSHTSDEHDVIYRMWSLNPLYKGEKVKYYTGPITIEDNVVIGARSIVLYNVTVEKNSLITAGSVVTKDVPPYSIVAGNPAKVIGNTKDLLKKGLSTAE